MKRKDPPKNLFIEFNRTLKTDKPIIAAVNGHAFAGGFRIAQMGSTSSSPPTTRAYAISEPKVGTRRWPEDCTGCRGRSG